MSNSFSWALNAPTVSFSPTSPTHAEGYDYDPVGNITRNGTIDLTAEYTDEDLHGDILSVMPDYPTNWAGAGSASASINAAHTSGSLSKMKYRFALYNTESNTTYRIDWDEVTTRADGTSSISMSANAAGTGDPVEPVHTSEREVLAPDWDNGTNGGTVSICVANVSVSVVSDEDGGSSPPGSGPGWLGGAGCVGCLGARPASNDAGGSGAVHAEFGLGRGASGLPAGNLRLWSAVPTPALPTTAALGYTAEGIADLLGVEVIRVNGRLRQLKAPQALADVVTINPVSQYEIRFYYTNQVGSKDGDLYQLSGNPFVTWRVENPDPTGADTNQLRLTELRGSSSKVYTCLYAPAATSWKLSPPGGLTERTVVTATDGPSATRLVTTTVSTPNGADALKLTRQFKSFRSGDTVYEAIVQETLSPDTNPQTTTWTYYNTNSLPFTPSGNLLPLRVAVHPGGNWEYYEYDSGGRKTMVASGLGDTPAPGPTETPSPSSCRRTEYSYTPLSQDDDGARYPYSPRTTIEYVGYQEVARSYLIPLPGERRDIRCQTPYAGTNATDNLVTITKYYTSGPNLNQVHTIENPDGTMAIYEYQTGSNGLQITTVYSGQPNGDRTGVTNGTQTVTIKGSLGEMISRVAYDLASNPNIVLASEAWSDYDEFARPRGVTYLDGTHSDIQFSCCAVDNETDRDGVTTQYAYDDANRRVASTRLGITTTNVLDAAGHVLKTIRIGTNGSPITLKQAAYDLAGELTIETNALGGVTTHTESTDPQTGGLIRTVTHPDGGTRSEAYYLDGSLKRVTATAAFPARYEYDADTDGAFTKEVKLDANGDDTSEWTKTYTDMVGRTYKTVYAPRPGVDNQPPFAQSLYNRLGQLWKQVDPDGVTTLYTNNAKGELEYTAIDLNRDDQINLAGTDRVTRTVSTVGQASSLSQIDVRRTLTYVWPTDANGTPLCLSTNEVSTDGLRSWSFAPAGVSQSQTVYAANGWRYTTNTAPDGSYTISTFQYGRLLSITRRDSLGYQLSAIGYSYDAHGRQNAATDARNGTTTFTFNDAGLVTSVTTPNPGTPGSSPQTTTTYYNKMLQATNIVQPDGINRFTEYFPTGQPKRYWGGRDHPVEYTYDYAGRMQTMKTWKDFAGDSGAAITTWNYNPYRGFLDNKRYADDTGPDYTYYASGRLHQRIWARGDPRITTTYSYNNAGDLSSVDYSDSTPGISYAYDRLGRQATIVQNGMTTTLTHGPVGQLLSESWSGSPLAGLSITNAYGPYLRRTNLALKSQISNLASTAYSYDNASRLATVSDGTNNATYSYLANSPLVGQITFRSNSVTRMTTTKQYDFLNRLTQIASTPSAPPAPPAPSTVSFNYTYNTANQRIRSTLADGSYWLYTYDSLGQVTSGKKYWSDSTPVAGQQFEYGFDDIGNRTSAKAGGDQNGANLRSASYSANSLNQYTSRDVPGAVDIMGLAFATNTVWVNGQPTYRKGEYFRKELLVDNNSTPLWTNITVAATGQSSVTGHQFVPQTPEQLTHDADGNLLTDGRWTYTWDAENRLVSLVAHTNIGLPQFIKFDYDAKGRRVHKQVWNSTNTNSTPGLDITFIHDDWNLLAILDLQSSILQSFTWGLDLSGSLRGAGGVGGLLSVTLHQEPNAGTYLYAYDGNGNVATLVSAGDGTLAAQYEYGPFGELLRTTGPLAKANPFRFSAKYHDDETDLLYYGYRYYNASAGRWLSRDPLGEHTFVSMFTHSMRRQEADNYVRARLGPLYVFTDGDPIDMIDAHGLVVVPPAVVAAVAAAATCMLPHFFVGMSKYPNDQEMRHCWTSCAAARTCGSAISGIAGIGFEVFSEALSLVMPGTSPNVADSLYDIANNFNGLDCAGWENWIAPGIGNLTRWCRQSCASCCKKKYGR